MAYHCSDKVIGNVDVWFSLSCAVCIYKLLSKYPLFEDNCIETYNIRINIIFWYISSHLTMLSLCSGCLLFVFTRPLQSENLLALIGSHCADATFAQMWVIAFQCHARYQSDWFHSLLSDPKLVGKMMCRKKGSSFISSLSCRKRLVITFLTAWHLIFWSWYPLNSWLTNMTGIWKTRNGISLLSTEIHDFGICLYDVKLYLGKRVDMLTSRMKSDLDQFWLRPSLSFCSSAMRCSMGWGTTCWCATESSTSSKSSKDHTFETAVWRLSSFKTQEFIVSHHQNRDVPFSQTPPEFRTISGWRHGDVKKTPSITKGVQQWIKKSTEVQGLQRRQLYSLNLL